MYEVLIERSAERDLKSLPTPLFHRIVSRIRALADNPRPSGCHKLVGSKNDTRRHHRIRHLPTRECRLREPFSGYAQPDRCCHEMPGRNSFRTGRGQSALGVIARSISTLREFPKRGSSPSDVERLKRLERSEAMERFKRPRP